MDTNNPLQLPLMKLARIIIGLKPRIIDAMGVEALDFIDENFAKHGYRSRSFIPWKVLASPKKPRPHEILTLDLTLRRSFTKQDASNHTTISTDIAYAQVHNEGLEVKKPYRAVITNHAAGGRFTKTKTQKDMRQVSYIRRSSISAHSFKMPQRQFMPIGSEDNPALRYEEEKTILHLLTQALPPNADNL